MIYLTAPGEGSVRGWFTDCSGGEGSVGGGSLIARLLVWKPAWYLLVYVGFCYFCQNLFIIGVVYKDNNIKILYSVIN